MQLDKDFVHYWSERYEVDELGSSAVERELLTVTHAAVTERGYLTADELKAIARWKSQRALGVLETDGDTIKDVTRVAFASDTPCWMRHHILCLLSGVRHPMASAILTVWNPETQSIFDVRVVEALRELHARGALAVALLPEPRPSLVEVEQGGDAPDLAGRADLRCRHRDRQLMARQGSGP